MLEHCYGQVLFLPTDNLANVHAFYAGTLGLTLVRDQGICRIYQSAPGAYVGFCERGYVIPADFRVVITLLIADVDGVYDALRAKGIKTESTPSLSETFNVYQFFLRDPNGYLVEVQRFEEPLPR
jgi:catechol 2,3-dioxygenase-like lactoylglutathione lyase family enzyme